MRRVRDLIPTGCIHNDGRALLSGLVHFGMVHDLAGDHFPEKCVQVCLLEQSVTVHRVTASRDFPGVHPIPERIGGNAEIIGCLGDSQEVFEVFHSSDPCSVPPSGGKPPIQTLPNFAMIVDRSHSGCHEDT